MKHEIHLHVWDSGSKSWCGPNELRYTLQPQILERLHEMPVSWYGTLSCRLPGEPEVDFHTTIHDLGDSAVAMIDVEDSTGGPAEVLSVLPGQRLSRVRQEFAFDFVGFLKFLGVADHGSELPLHDYIEKTVKEADSSTTLIFSVDRGSVQPELSLAMSQFVENLSMGMLQWMTEKDVICSNHNGSRHNGFRMHAHR